MSIMAEETYEELNSLDPVFERIDIQKSMIVDYIQSLMTNYRIYVTCSPDSNQHKVEVTLRYTDSLEQGKIIEICEDIIRLSEFLKIPCPIQSWSKNTFGRHIKTPVSEYVFDSKVSTTVTLRSDDMIVTCYNMSLMSDVLAFMSALEKINDMLCGKLCTLLMEVA